MTKPTLGIFSLTCCEGCQIEILDLEDVILDIAEKVDILSFRLAQKKHIDQEMDIAFLEGSVSTKDDENRTREIREKSKILVALGSCACTGGVQAAKNYGNKKAIESAQYPKKKPQLETVEPVPISAVVPVDFELRGCPLDKLEFVEILKVLLLELKPYQREWSVCVECKINENPCLLEEGELCLGPVTYSGCSAVCPTNKLYCIGCRGIMEDANIAAYINMLKEKGHKIKDIKQAFQTIFGTHKRIKEVK